MKKILLIILLLCGIGALCYSDEYESDYLKIFFDGKTYLTESYKFDNTNILYSYICADNSTDIVSKALFYSFEKNIIKTYLIIDNEKITDNSKTLFQGIIATQQFYGYKVKIIEKNKCISTSFYTNEGKNVTEGPVFLWNSKNQTFSKYEIDRSQW